MIGVISLNAGGVLSLAILGTGRRVVDQDVGRLEISVDEVLLMDVAYSYQASAGAKGDHGSNQLKPYTEG